MISHLRVILCVQKCIYTRHKLEYPLFSLNTATNTVHNMSNLSRYLLCYILHLILNFENLKICNLITVAVFNKNDIKKD